ncbi:ExeA family protein [Uliginosibacterium aquaticum]|uniref:AAA family ATPase n=1 Tax=Uliginosibacterium aquaticum TaxID=2731212 RepID=A0ABX2IJZ2_9RHOO|nr:AAA family ATPase [Uliginosibacterium aquaticum]NSL54375.1 AAA family ATPase [Uliginosibacterium aquaticum]
MYREHFGLSHPPFRITPQTEHFYTGAQRGPLLEALLFAVSNDEGIIRVSGEVGTGKTMLCRMLIDRLPTDTLVIYIANPSLSPSELIATVAHELQVEAQEGHSLLRQIERRLITLYAEGRRVLAIIDEAHAMPRESLDQVRLLSNLETSTRKLLQIVLFGQPELDAILAERPMRSLRERITQSFRLQPLDRQQTRDYLDFRLRAAGYRGPELFGDKVLNLIVHASRGLTRRINILADKTLLAAFADNTHTLNQRHAEAALRDADYHAPIPWQRISQIGLAALLLIALAGAGYLWQQRVPGSPTTTPEASASTPASTQSTDSSAASTTSPPAKTATAALTARSNPAVALITNTPSNSASNTDTERFAPIPEQLGVLARERLQASRADMQQISDKQWFIQLRSIPASNASTLENFIPAAAKAIDVSELRLYVVKNDPRQTIGVIYGSYPDATAAQNGLAKLPGWIRAGGAFVRPFKSLR